MTASNLTTSPQHINVQGGGGGGGGGALLYRVSHPINFFKNLPSDLRPSFMSIPGLSVNQMVDNRNCSIILFHRIMIYPVDRAIQHLNNRLP